mgnify:FL=1
MQDGVKDCGICSLLTIVRYYNGNYSKEYLRTITNTTKDGVTAFALLEAAKNIGFDAVGVTGDALDIAKKNLPCIAHVVIQNKYKHFLVIYKIDKKNKVIMLADPSQGLVKMNVSDFEKMSTKVFLFLKPNKKIPYVKNESKVKNIIYNFLSENKMSLFIILILSFLYNIISIMTSFNFQLIMNYALKYGSKYNLYIIFISMLILYILKELLIYIRNLVVNFISLKLDYSLITSVYSHILSLPYSYYRNRPVGEVIMRINDLSELKDSVSQLIVTFLLDIFLIIITLIFLYMINFKLTLIVIFVLILYFLVTFIYNKFLFKMIRLNKKDSSAVNTFMVESIEGVMSIRGSNTFLQFKDKFSSLYNNFIISSYNFFKKYNTLNFLNNFLISILIVVIITMGSIFVIDGNMDSSSIITYYSVLCFFLEPVKNVANFDVVVKKSRISIERIEELLMVEEEKILLDNQKITGKLKNILFKDVTFSYDFKNNVVNKLNLKIDEGEKVVIYGKSGSGKSTVAKILTRYLDVERGKVFINGYDINDYNLWSIREGITYVSQNEFLLTDTIYNNINMKGTRDAEYIFDVCKMIGVDKIVKFKNGGYNMILEENGSNISGGERERILLARAFVRDSDIYILDESFSEIDSLSEREILGKIFSKYKDKMIIVISHRMDNNDLYDRRICMEELWGNVYKKLSN